jgi:6,7-dimethyl-8-ribityllumazine synthase
MTAPNVLIVEATYYGELAAEILRGATEALEARGASYVCVQVPGVLEIPAAVRYHVGQYDGFITLGCVIRGETTHYDIVSNESARALMDLSVNHQLALGNGIQTVENSDQAWARCKVDKLNKGGGAANACLDMIELKQKSGV